MTEATQVNGAVRTHLGIYGRFKRMEHAIEVGWPDWHYTLRGASGWIEAKLIARNGKCPRSFTREQLMWGEAEVEAGGRWFLLGLREPRWWLLYDAPGARAWFDGGSNRPVVEVEGRFPTAEIIRTLRRPDGTPT